MFNEHKKSEGGEPRRVFLKEVIWVRAPVEVGRYLADYSYKGSYSLYIKLAKSHWEQSNLHPIVELNNLSRKTVLPFIHLTFLSIRKSFSLRKNRLFSLKTATKMVRNKTPAAMATATAIIDMTRDSRSLSATLSSPPYNRVEHSHWSRSSRYCALIGGTLLHMLAPRPMPQP